jgi:protease I
MRSHIPLLASTAAAVLMAGSAPFSADAHAAALAPTLDGKHVAFLVGEGVHDGETFMPMAYLVNRGATVTIIGIQADTVNAYNSDFEVRVQKTIGEVSVDEFDALVIPGGRSPALLREHDAVVAFVRDFFGTGKPVAGICHGPQVLVTAGVLEGFRATGVSGISDELKGAGAHYVDEPLVRDRNLITSRVPGDLPVFSKAIAASLAAGEAPAR